MKRARKKLFLIFILVMVMCWVLYGITVYGGSILVLLDDTGSSAESWSMTTNRVASTSYLDGAPSSGNPGNYYYFTNNSGSRDVGSAEIQRDAMFNADQKILSNLGQLKVDFYMDIAGWSGDTDRVAYYIYSLKGGVSTELFYSGNYSNDTVWRAIGEENLDVPKDADGIRIKIVVQRFDGSDLDVYLDNIRLYLHEETLPVMTGATVTKIIDWQDKEVPLKTDPISGKYLDNWVNTADTIIGNIGFSEPVTTYNYPDNLNTNMLYSNGNKICGSIGEGFGSYSYSHEYRIPLDGADKLIGEDSSVKFVYGTWGSGPFNYPVCDLGGNYGLSEVMKPNIDSYNIKLDNASPTITTPWDSFESYVRGRTSIDIVVCEKNKGTKQSPLTLTYFWEYINSSNIKVTEPEKEILISSTVVPVEDDTNTIYTVKIDIPNGSNIPPYQDFWLSAEVNDEARNPYGNNIIYCKVNQKDSTPPVITWDKSIHADKTEVNLGITEDTVYTTSRTVSLSAEDLESGVEDLGSDFGGIKYLWTKEPYNADSDIIDKRVFPMEGSKYIIQGTSEDAPLEGLYYLNILAENTTGTSCVVSKGFYFDNEGPRVSGDVIYSGGNPVSAQYQVQDRALQNKFLYTLLVCKNSGILEFETVVEPDISGGLKDDGMWKVLELEGTGGARIANITGVLDKITLSGYYKLVTRYYDEYYNCMEIESTMWYDFIPPELEVIKAGNPSVFQQNHDVVIKVTDNMGHVNLSSDYFSIKWIAVGSTEEIPASFEMIEPQQQWIGNISSGKFNGKYYLKVKAIDGSYNSMEKVVSIDGSSAEFCFDNSPPVVTLTCDTEKSARTLKFAYSGLKDNYTSVTSARYGISNTPDGEPLKWIDIAPASGSGEIIYPDAFALDGEWYLSILLRDTLGNEQIIHKTEPFRIDVTDPSGSISFVNGYTNKLDVPLQLKIDELKSIEQQSFKTILSGDITMLSDAAIADAPPTDWKDISYENGLAVYNWQLSDIVDGEQWVYARFMDEAGNLSSIYGASIILDRTAPSGEITYNIAVPTAGNVTATLTMEDNYNVTLLNNDKASSYIFNRNGEFEFVLADQAGNKTRVKAIVSNIDRDPPEANITYSHPRDIWTNQSITATLNLMDENGYIILGDGKDVHTFNENGEFIFQFRDTLGNEGSIKAEVKNIDKVLPVGSIIYASSDTAPVTVYLSVNEPVEVTNNAGSFRYVFDENGEFTFEFEDKAGNTATATAGVYTITSAAKYVDVNYSDSGRLTNENISAEFTPLSDWAEITSPTVTEEVYGSYTYNFIENGDCPVSIRVFSGEEESSIRTVAGSVYNIDRVPPEAAVYISTEGLTNQNVAVTLLPYDDRGKAITIINNGGVPEYVFTENRTFIFDFMDEAGNIGHKAITVSNIDKSVPIAHIRYFTDATKVNSVFAEISFPEETEEVTILNNNGSNTFEFVENGAFTFKYADKAGNEGYAVTQVTSLSDGVSAGTIEYYIEGIKVDDINGAITNKSVSAKLVLDEAGGPYTIVNNGGSSTYAFEQNGEFTFIYEDSKKNRGFAAAKVSTIDKEAPSVQILADKVGATNQNVTINVSYSDNKGIAEVLHNMEAENTTASEGKLIYTCKENKTIQVTVSDTAGNTTTKEFAVNYIDKKMPTGTIVYTPNSMTNKDVKAVLTLNEPGLILNNSGRMEYIFIQNGEFTFEFEDIAGNSTTMTASVNWIDKSLPAASVEYSNTQMTNKPVIVTLNTEADAVILNNGGAAERTFYTNGEFTFRVVDKAGNEAGIKAVVGNIDVEKPKIILNGYTHTSILQNEAYTEAGYSAVDNVDGDIKGKVVVEGSVNTGVPGIYILKYKVSDAVGNPCEVSRTVRVIGPDEIVLVLNDIMTGGEQVIISDNNINIDCIGNEGSCIIKWAEGKRTQAYFKGEGNIIEVKGTVSLADSRWYTFFIQDRERKTKCIQVYINE